VRDGPDRQRGAERAPNDVDIDSFPDADDSCVSAWRRQHSMLWRKFAAANAIRIVPKQ
jgi:hypothetical protein